MPIATVTLKRWSDLRKYDKPGRIYRGQADATWHLASSLQRCSEEWKLRGRRRQEFEALLCREFRRGYHHYVPATPLLENRLEWASIMQHHGAPTRLLDFTYSIYCAAYFALERTPNRFAAIWSIDAKWANRASKDALRAAGHPEVAALPKRGNEADEAKVSGFVFDNEVRMAWPLTPFRLNERLRIQRGIFLVPGDIRVSLMENLAALPGYDRAVNVLKIRIPRALRVQALRQLFHMNISRTSLFPGLDGYADSLGVYHPTVFSPIDWD